MLIKCVSFVCFLVKVLFTQIKSLDVPCSLEGLWAMALEIHLLLSLSMFESEESICAYVLKLEAI